MYEYKKNNNKYEKKNTKTKHLSIFIHIYVKGITGVFPFVKNKI